MDHSVAPAARRFEGRFTWLSSQWKLRAYPAQFWVEINTITTGGVLTLYIAAPPNGSSVWVRVVDEVAGAIFEQEITADLPAATQFLSPRLFMNTGATAAAVAYDCAGVYVETDF